MKRIYRLRFWSPGTAKVTERWFLKPLILIGSDSSCDLVVPELSGLQARLDLSRESLEDLVSLKIQSVSDQELFQIESIVFQWISIPIVQKKYATIYLSGFLVVLCIIAFFFWPSSHPRHCRWSDKLVSSVPQFKIGRANFLQALRDKNWVKAKVELDSIREKALDGKINDGCDEPELLSKLNWRLTEEMTKSLIKDSQIVQASLVLSKVRASEDPSYQRLFKRLLKEIRSIFMKGYILEDTNPQLGQNLMESAEEACVHLGLEPKCFKPPASQTSFQTSPLHEPPPVD